MRAVGPDAPCLSRCWWSALPCSGRVVRSIIPKQFDGGRQLRAGAGAGRCLVLVANTVPSIAVAGSLVGSSHPAVGEGRKPCAQQAPNRCSVPRRRMPPLPSEAKMPTIRRKGPAA